MRKPHYVWKRGRGWALRSPGSVLPSALAETLRMPGWWYIGDYRGYLAPLFTAYLNPHCLNDGKPCNPNGDGGCVSCERVFSTPKE